MTRFLIVILMFAVLVAGDGDKGRKGNKRYHEKKYQEAASLYKEGIAEMKESTKPAIRTGLFNNLGSAFNRLESYEEAEQAFAQAIATAGSKTDLTRATYNAGNTSFQAQDPQRALELYRKALIADPNNQNARFNYEFVRRLIESQKQQSNNQSNQQQQQNQDQDQQNQQDQEQKKDDQEEQQDQDQQQQQQQQNQDEDQQQQEEEQDSEQQQEEKEEMTKEQAEQILKALQNDEEELMRQVWRMKGKPRSVEKDW